MSDVGFNSRKYWENRYKSGGNSGAGSLGRLAKFKASFLNGFIKYNKVNTVVELGCGDGHQLSLLSFQKYVGLDVSSETIKKCKLRFQDKEDWSFFLYDDIMSVPTADISLSMDVIFHLVEDEVFALYMRNLFMISSKFVIIYSSNHENSSTPSHVRHWAVLSHVQRNFPEWTLIAHITNPYPFNKEDVNNTSFCDFMVFGLTDASCIIQAR